MAQATQATSDVPASTGRVETSRRARSFNIVKELAVADFRLKYNDSALGYIWSMLNPLFMFLVLHFVFSYLFVSQVPKFTFYLLSGIVVWNFFGDATLSGMNGLQAKAPLVKKIFFPRILLVYATTLTAFISFAINMALLVLIVFLFDHISVDQLFIVIPLCSVVLLATGMALILSVLFIHFRDTVQIWNVLLSVGFWLTPIVYDALTAPVPLKTVALLLNPAGRILVMLRAFLIYGDSPSMELILTTVLLSIAIYLFGVWLFNRHEYKIPEYL